MLWGVEIWGQHGSDVRLEWGAEGIEALSEDCAVLVIVDVLSFSTTVDLVVGRGGRVLPLPWRDERAATAATEAGAVLAGQGEWTLRPSSVVAFPPGKLLALPSPNGATLCAAAAKTRVHVLMGCLRNASAVAEKAHRLAGGSPIGVIPGGERWGVNLLGGKTFGPLRPCVEDHLGAGAIVAALLRHGRSASAEARLAATAYWGTDIGVALAECTSGRELTAGGHGGDISLAAEIDVSTRAPMLDKGVLQ
ncbi:MAG: 2-phosphosulfolactate phosphatase [Actinomycetota bacterium]|jgi:2-phosphosulfolactate phosphatase|nr:2-phosphosulfolactate phosphatase [Actinomycetota bacterium]